METTAPSEELRTSRLLDDWLDERGGIEQYAPSRVIGPDGINGKQPATERAFAFSELGKGVLDFEEQPGLVECHVYKEALTSKKDSTFSTPNTTRVVYL